ncbi:flagellar protein FliT [Bacillus sp. 1NLA3E]|uniref:flagellar protein FliT n=1 Tax=Bacillus sp. 1NLA3E TaxID=666686 RepID=UPI000247F325|nr:flagellar protein FliT [Bacillus sp. 1NLA3E]AGK55376.1 hypothetical protein B1NLA3E_18160 [Bacillus sp. 1NLA3E]
MDEFIIAISEITEDMERALNEENDPEFEKLLTERNALMGKVDEYRVNHPCAKYSPKSKQLLDAALQVDMRMAPVLKERMAETESTLIKIEKNKKVSKKYSPYMKQTNGVFVDSKK